MNSPLTNYESDSSCSSNGNNNESSANTVDPPPRRLTAELTKTPPTSPFANTTTPTTSTAAAAEHERQTLLLMLLAQVCSLHDATPRTFVVHVLALFERGILDSNSIRFLFDLGLVPRGYSEQFSGCFEESASSQHGDDNDQGNGSSDGGSDDNNHAQSGASDEAAIVPYASNNNNSQQHLFLRHLPPPPTLPNSSNNKTTTKQQNNAMASRQIQASAIRKHLAQQESIDSSSARSSVFGSAGAGFIPGITSAAVSTTTASYTNSNGKNNYGWSRKNSSLTSVEESFHTNFPLPKNDNNEEHPSRRDQFDNNPNNNNNTTHTQQQQQLTTTTHPTTTSWSVENHPLSLSRYQREFHQLSLLATGSFGSVYHAIHKLEHKPYAVKRVTFSTTGYYANILALVIREVRCLAQLDHKNCVRYYTSWLEPSWMTGGGDSNVDGQRMMSEEEVEEEEEEASENDLERRSNSRPKLLPYFERVVDEINNSTDEIPSMQRLETILYGGKDENSDDGFEWDPVSSTELQRHDELPSHRTTTKHQASVYSFGSQDDIEDDSDVSDWTQDMNGSDSSGFGFRRQGSLELIPAADQHKASSTAAPYKYQICLFIQMQLCHPTTLADWIKERNQNCSQFGAEERQVRARPAFEIFRQIVNGLAHVHSKGIIHRDLKPANIFASDDGAWLVGDFGLSKMMRDAQGGVDLDLHDNGIILPNGYSNGSAQHHTAGVGTASYAAPEQITRKNYDSAVDIFSLGLILLELFSNFTSEHERAVAFHDCRYHGEVTSWMSRTYPDVSSLVLACTQKDWTLRPTASEILSASVFQEGLSGVDFYRAELKALNQELVRKDDLIQSQNDVIQSQNFELSEKDEVIQQLKLQLENAGISSQSVIDEKQSSA